MNALKRLLASLFTTRRGVVSVLAMMFLVLFGSLGLAMAIASKGNLRTAATQLHVTKAIGAAETGLAVAKVRLEEAARRFVVDKGEITSSLGTKLWRGTYTNADARVTILPPPSGFVEVGLPAGLASALANVHAADQNIATYTGSLGTPTIGGAPAGMDGNEYVLTDWVMTPAVAIDGSGSDGSSPAAFQITYAPLTNGTDVRVIVTGYSSIGVSGSNYTYASNGQQSQPVTRVLQQDFRIVKRHEHAILSPSRVLIGKNVAIVGNVGERYDQTDEENGDPAVIRSDFLGLNVTLDQKLVAFYENVQDYDVDGDGRLRVGHRTEGDGIPPATTDYDGDGVPDNAYADVTGDGYVDDFDIFINHYDANHDGKVALSDSLRLGTTFQGLAPEFTVDNDLALQIDGGLPDRNRNQVYGFIDTNVNGRWDVGEQIVDYDATRGTYPDRVLGWRDGVIDRKDQYAKVRGQLAFRVTRAQWENDRGHDYQSVITGAIRPDAGQSPVRFGVSDNELPALAAGDFSSEMSGLTALADGLTFDQQVAAQLGIAAAQLPTYVEASTDTSAPRYWRADLDNGYVRAQTGRDLWEKMPFNSPSYTDWYVRPRYENMVFMNVQIPRGNNGLFINCTFVGATYVRTYGDNTHQNWSLYGQMNWNASNGRPEFNTAPLDKSDFLRYTSGLIQDGPANYADFPNPPVIDGVTRVGAARNTKLYSNNIRFHDCLFVGSIVSETPSAYTQVRNKIQFTGGTRFAERHPTSPDDPDLNPPEEDLTELAKSSMMLPQYSVDIGSFNSPTDTYEGPSAPTAQNVSLTGTVIAGVLDARGTTSIDGTLLLTFNPIAGQGPLQVNGIAVGNPANYNASLGYFGPLDGENESIDPQSLPFINGVRTAGWDLDGDGLADITPPNMPTQAQLDAGATAVPFYGYGRITLKINPDRPMPNGIMLPLRAIAVPGSYREGRH
ncbi:MAG: hypothetical protein AB7K52_01590 [Phycisphaerales bacterium]